MLETAKMEGSVVSGGGKQPINYGKFSHPSAVVVYRFFHRIKQRQIGAVATRFILFISPAKKKEVIVLRMAADDAKTKPYHQGQCSRCRHKYLL